MQILSVSQFWALPAVWIAALGGALMAANALRAWAAPGAFATYLGLPLHDARDRDLLRVYALRAAFLALAVTALLSLRAAQPLALLLLSASIMPAGDTYLTRRAGAPAATVLRHAIITLRLLAAGAMLLRH